MIGASREDDAGKLVEPILLLGLWVAAQVAGLNSYQQYRRHHLSLARRAQYSADFSVRLRLRHLLSKWASCRSTREAGAGVAGRGR